jgi:hypothetical protein
MNELKMKAYQGGRMVYFTLEDITLIFNHPQGFLTKDDLGVSLPAKIMVYIGKQDKFHQDIYDGDIVRDYIGRIRQIAYANHYTRWMASRDGEICDYYLNDGISGDWQDRNTEYMEVRGNIYENPELLKERNK